MTTVFVTGATGFVGRAVTPELLKHLEPEDRLIMLARRSIECTNKRVVKVSGDLESWQKLTAWYARPILSSISPVRRDLAGKLPVIAVAMFLDYYWMDDPIFRDEIIDASRKKSLSDYVHEIARFVRG